MYVLSTAEVEVMGALADGDWKTATDVNTVRDGLHVQAIRGNLKELARRGLVEKGRWSRTGEFRITDHGRDELTRHNQLRLA